MPIFSPKPNPTAHRIVPDFPALAAANPWMGAAIGGPQAMSDGGYVQQYANATAWGRMGGTPYEVHGDILAKYNALGGPQGFLGYPISNELACADKVGAYSHFEQGSIYWRPGLGSFEVHGAIHALWAKLGYEAYGYPITDETGTPDSVGRFNHFRTFFADNTTADASIYWTPSTGAHEVHGAIRTNWAQIGWETSYLGYPVSDEHDANGGRQSDFQNGSIFWTAANGTQLLPQTFVVNCPINFSDGTPVGGNGQLVLFCDGTVHVSGLLHDCGFPSYDCLTVFTVKDANGRAYAASEPGHLSGTDALGGSRDHDWDNWATDNDVRNNWPAIRSGGVGGGTVTATSDWSAQKIAEDVVSVVGVILAIISLPFLGGSSDKPKNNSSYNTNANAPTGYYAGVPDDGAA